VYECIACTVLYTRVVIVCGTTLGHARSPGEEGAEEVAEAEAMEERSPLSVWKEGSSCASWSGLLVLRWVGAVSKGVQGVKGRIEEEGARGEGGGEEAGQYTWYRA
jgi:hypothetical protein